MQRISFAASIKNGYIKIPERYSNLNNKKVLVKIFAKEVTDIDWISY
jgi:hypothetical protein